MSFGEWIWTLLMWFFFFAYLMVLFRIFADIIRDDELSGWGKAIWVLCLIFFVFIAALVYVIVRGKGMNERTMQQAQAYQAQQAQYIRTVASGSGGALTPAEQVGKAKALLDSGAITDQEYQLLKAKALA